MGQQQLLLLVLATVIVGLATVAGIQAFEQGQTRANQDALTQQAVKIASDVQARVKEPSQFGGYDGSLSDAQGSISLEELGYSTNSDSEYEAADGTCVMGEPGTVSAPTTSSGNPIEVTCSSNENEVVAVVDGLKPDDIVSAAITLGS
jgi:hypothetical protein